MRNTDCMSKSKAVCVLSETMKRLGYELEREKEKENVS